MRACYYTALLDDQEYSPIRPLVDWLDYNGYTVVTKPLKEFTDASGRRKFKGNMDIELAVDAMEMAQLPRPRGPVLRRRRLPPPDRGAAAPGLRVTVVSTIRTQPPMIADELRRQADTFLELNELSPYIAREHRPRSRSTTTTTTRTRRRSAPRRVRGASTRTPERAPRRRRRAGGDARCAGAAGGLRALPAAGAVSRGQPARFPDWHNAPVASFGDPAARLLIVGLAPGLRGANRTGRPFTGDHAGELLYATLRSSASRAGDYRAAPDDGLELVDCRITNAVRCVPPENRPLGDEVNACRRSCSAS